MGFSASDVVPFTQARSHLSELADQAKAGAEKIITKNGESYVALIDSDRLDYYHRLERERIHLLLIDDAKRHGITVLPIDVRRSLWDCILEPVAQRGWGIRMGLRYVKGLGVRERAAFEAALLDHPFESLPDFVRRVRIPRSMLERLAQAGVAHTPPTAGAATTAGWPLAETARPDRRRRLRSHSP